MPVYNTVVTVIANVEAADPEAAVGKLARELQRHRFETMTGDWPMRYSEATHAEAGTEADEFPLRCFA